MAEAEPKTKVITLRALLLGAFLSAFFAYFTVVTQHREPQVDVTATQIPVFPYVMLFLTVLMINPFLRLIRFIRPMSVAEILIVFMMGVVSSGISTYGFVAQFVPLASSLFYKDWNSEQSQWDRYIEPHVNEAYFVSEPGIQAAAREYESAISKRDELKTVHLKAVSLDAKEQILRDAEAKAGASAATDTAIAVMRQRASDARVEWDLVKEKYGAPEVASVLQTYPGMLDTQEALAAEKKVALNALKEKAFTKIDLFRRGLPKTQQAYPGFMPMPGDDSASYFSRLKRLMGGRAALSHVNELQKSIEGAPDGDPLDSAAVQKALPLLQATIDKLAPLADEERIQNTVADFEQRQASVTQQLGETLAELSRLNAEQRVAEPAEQAGKQAEIDKATDRKKSLEREKKDLGVQVQGINRQKEISNRIKATVTELQTLQGRLQVSPASAGEMRKSLGSIADKFPSFDASYRRYFFGDVPWQHWTGVLLRWGILIFLTYLILMTFNVLIFRQWAHNEKLIYPLAELPEILAGHKDEKPGMFPQVYRSGLFWVGVSISAGILGWNLIAHSQTVPGLQPLELKNLWEPYIKNSPLKGLMPTTKSAIFFTMIGLAFLAPAKVTFSMWFFWVGFMVQLLVLVWLGYGNNESDFLKDWSYNMNFCNAQGGGAMLIFAAVVMYKCRRYLLCAFSPTSVQQLEPDERKELRISSGLFVTGSIALILMLWLGLGANLWHTVFAYAIVMMITIGLVRGVAEGGLLGFQAWSGPFHFIRNIAGFDKSWSSPSLFTPLMVYYGVFFLDIKTFIAPAMANSLKVRDDLRMERGRYHIGMFLCIAVAVVVAVGVSIIMAYADGASAMNNWFFEGLPKSFYDQIKKINQSPMAASPTNTGWIAAGAAVMIALLYFRQTMFWLPHPIGLIMLVNPIMSTYWFPIFLGWIAKHLVTKYGNRDTYARSRALFIGLIAGELLIVMLALYFSYSLNVRIPIDLNRNL
jgi:hypothetical protein